jgi:TATA-box binding protein (TBP) (component of TFIID and TFIIIB)
MRLFYLRTNHVILVRTRDSRCLYRVSEILKTGKYSPKTYSALTLHYSNPKTTVIMFSTGNITNMGSRSHNGSLYCLHVLKRKLKLEIVHVRLTNAVVTFSIAGYGKLSLSDLNCDNPGTTTYDPGLFPCCTLNIDNSTAKANIFDSGKVVLTGCQTSHQIETNIRFVVTTVKKSIIHKDIITTPLE